jgi:hypothetical protein
MYKITVNSYVDVESPSKPYKVRVMVAFKDERFKRRLINVCAEKDTRMQISGSLIAVFFKKKLSIDILIYNFKGSLSLENDHYPLRKLIEENGVFGFSRKREADDFSIRVQDRLSRFIDENLKNYNKLLAESESLGE